MAKGSKGDGDRNWKGGDDRYRDRDDRDRVGDRGYGRNDDRGDRGYKGDDRSDRGYKGDRDGKGDGKGKKGEKGEKGEGKGKKGEKGEKGKGKPRPVKETGLKGKVLNFIPKKPSGFIKRMDGKPDVFFDIADIEGGDELKVGDPLAFDISEGFNGLDYAANVTRLPKDTVLVEEKPRPTNPNVTAAKAGSLTGGGFSLGGGVGLGRPGSLLAPPSLRPGGMLSPGGGLSTPLGGMKAKKDDKEKGEEDEREDPPGGPDEDGIEWGRIISVYGAYGFLRPLGAYNDADIFFRASDVIGMNGTDPGMENENALQISLPSGRMSNGFKCFWLAKDDEVSYEMSRDNKGQPCAAKVFRESKGAWRQRLDKRRGGRQIGEDLRDKVKRLCDMSPDQVLQNASLLKEVLDSPDFNPSEDTYKVVALLASKGLVEDDRSDRIYKLFLDSWVMQTSLRTTIIKQSQGKHSGTFLEDCLKLMVEIVLRSDVPKDLRGHLPLQELCEAYELSLKEGSSITKNGLPKDVVQMLTCLNKHFPDEVNLDRVFGVKAKKIVRSAAEDPTELMEADYYQDMPILPTSQEMLGQCAFEIQANMRTYEQCSEYVQTHFMLLREDYIEPLRAGIKQFMSGSFEKRDLHVYTGVKVIGVLSTWEGLVYRIELQKSQVRNVNWEKSKQLMYGSLLCFSDDNFQSLIWATVWRREEDLMRTKAQLDVRLPFDPFDDRLSPGKTFSCIENVTIYFEAYRHVLVALQLMRPSDVPFQGTLLPPQPDPAPPLFLKAETDTFNFHNTFESCQKANAPPAPKTFKILQDWPSDLQTSLDIDPSQLDAMKHALTHNMALIQGPPGTGKTFMGLKIVQCLLDNTRSFRYSPMLVVCYTNHALDQFLEGIFKFNGRIARIGSRSKSEVLANCNLKELVNDMQPSKEYFHARRALMERRDSLREKLGTVLRDVDKHHVEMSDMTGTDGIMTDKEFKKFWKGYLEYMGDDIKHVPKDADEIEEDWWDRAMRAWLDTSGDPSKYVQQLFTNQKKKIVTSQSVFGEEKKEEDEGEEAEDMLHDRKLDVEAGEKQKSTHDLFVKMENAWLPFWEDYTETLAPEMRSFDWREEKDLWRTSINMRREAYRQWLLEVHHNARENLPEISRLLERNAEHRASLERDRKLAVLREMAVVGMTTTAVSKYQQLLKELRPEMVVVEEAAEVLEAHILTALHPRTQHVVLIGDHQQLRPSTAVYRLSKNFALDVSMFERLIKNGATHVTLEQQRRMHPSISRLMKPLYPNLRDHFSTSEYPEIMGMGARVHFMSHPHFEDDEGESHSKQNSFEANFIRALVAHLVKSGYEESRITVLSPYLGQVRIIKNKLRDHPSTREVNVFAVDNFQGEENDIIVISLVRSNRNKTMGFLSVENRINVALTRARHGMFIVGNGDMLKGHKLWSSITSTLSEDSCFGTTMPLIHQDSQSIFQVKCADDISVMLDDPLLEGGDAGFEPRVVADRWASLDKDDRPYRDRDYGKGSKGKDKGDRGGNGGYGFRDSNFSPQNRSSGKSAYGKGKGFKGAPDDRDTRDEQQFQDYTSYRAEKKKEEDTRKERSNRSNGAESGTTDGAEEARQSTAPPPTKLEALEGGGEFQLLSKKNDEEEYGGNKTGGKKSKKKDNKVVLMKRG